MADKNTVVAIHLSRSEDLQQQSGFEVRELSIVGKDYRTEENIVGYYSAGDRATCRVPADHPGVVGRGSPAAPRYETQTRDLDKG